MKQSCLKKTNKNPASVKNASCSATDPFHGAAFLPRPHGISQFLVQVVHCLRFQSGHGGEANVFPTDPDPTQGLTSSVKMASFPLSNMSSSSSLVVVLPAVEEKELPAQELGLRWWGEGNRNPGPTLPGSSQVLAPGRNPWSGPVKSWESGGGEGHTH